MFIGFWLCLCFQLVSPDKAFKQLPVPRKLDMVSSRLLFGEMDSCKGKANFKEVEANYEN